jgi:glycosyltransferase involved in cell wall biosynthesis
MKILSISDANIWPWGKNRGIPSIFASQKRFVEKGHRVYFLCPAKSRDLPLRESYEGVEIFRFKLPFGLTNLYVYNLPACGILPRLKRTVVFNLEWLFFHIFSLINGIAIGKKIKPHLIYAHGLTAAFPAFIISKIFRAKLVVRVYGARELYWQWDHFWSRIKECRDYLSFKVPADYFFITRDGNHADILARKLGVCDRKIYCWRNGIDFDMYKPDPGIKDEVISRLKIDPQAKIIISTSRIIDLYGVDRLICSIPQLSRSFKNFVCLIANEGQEKSKLEEYARRNNIQPYVRFLGMLDHAQLKDYLNSADIFVLLSRYHNCTNTMWEAMVTGKCIVTVDNQSIREVLEPGKNAILVSADKLGELVSAMERVLTDDSLMNRLGRNSRKRALEVLESWPDRIDKELEILEKLVK